MGQWFGMWKLMTQRNLIVCFAVLVLLPISARGAEWISPLHRDNPLVGKIWQPSQSKFVSRATVENAARNATFVLLGESHNNADHHRLQAELVEGLVKSGRAPALVFEMINQDRQGNIDDWRASKPSNAASLGPALNWAKSGWPDWTIYQPIANAVLKKDLPILAGNPPRKLTREISRKGFSILGKDAERLGLETELPKQSEADIRRDLYESHCKLIPEDRLTPLVAVQRARDAILADNVIKGHEAADTQSAVLIAGSGHARRDHGVPFYISARMTDAKILSLAFMQVSQGETDITDYAEIYGGKLPFDFVWFTPRADSRDRCAELRERFKNSHRKRKATP